MAKRPEQKLKDSTRKEYEKIGVDITYIESEMTELGIADTFICGRGVQGWIEYKVEYSSDWPCSRRIAFRPGQYPWLMRKYKHGVLSLVCIQYMNGIAIVAIQDVDSYYRRPKIEKTLFMEKFFDAQAAINWMRVKQLELPGHSLSAYDI